MPNSASSSVAKLRQNGAAAQRQAPKTAQTPAQVHSSYAPTSQEQMALDAVAASMGQVPRVRYQLIDGKAHMQLVHKDETAGLALLMHALAIRDPSMFQGYMGTVAGYAVENGKIDEDRVNFIVQFVAAMKPKDPAETLMLTQMAAVQYLTMMFASRLGRASELRSCDFYERTVNKLTRTYAAQLQTLKQYRSDGKQKIVVKHVTVNEGGQAIVGDVTHGGAGGASENIEATA